MASIPPASGDRNAHLPHQSPPHLVAQSVTPQPAPGLPQRPPKGCTDAKPRLTKEQTDVLEAHFQQQPKPPTDTKKQFADALEVNIEKINNWFQNRRAKAKAEKKKLAQQNEFNANMIGYPMSVHSFDSPESQGPPQPPATAPFYHVTGPSTGMRPNMGVHLGSISEVERTTSQPQDIFSYFMAAAQGQPSLTQPLPASMAPQNQVPSYDTSHIAQAYPNGHPISMPHMQSNEPVLSSQAFNVNSDFANVPPVMAPCKNSGDQQDNTVPVSAGQASSLHGSDNSVNPLASKFSNWTVDQEATNDFDDFGEAYPVPYTMPQAAVSESILPSAWPSNGQFSQGQMYQHTNASAQALWSSSDLSVDGQFTVTPSETDEPNVFATSAQSRRNSSTSNLAANVEAIQIQASTPDGFKQPLQPMTIAARRQKPPPSALRSASFSNSLSGLSSPGANSDHTLRRIKSTGFSNQGGRIQKHNPGSAQRSPMAMSFASNVRSPKFARHDTSSIGPGGTLAPLTPATPSETDPFSTLWQNPSAIGTQGPMPQFGGAGSLDNGFAMEPAAVNGNGTTGNSPPSTPMNGDQWNRARLGGNSMYRDTPPQSAPATQQSFALPLHGVPMPPPVSQMRTGFYSSTDLTATQPKPEHLRRTSLPGSAQPQTNGMYQPPQMQFNDAYHYAPTYDDMSFSQPMDLMGNISFSPAPNPIPTFATYPPTQGPGAGNMGHQGNAQPQRTYTFANQGPRDFDNS